MLFPARVADELYKYLPKSFIKFTDLFFSRGNISLTYEDVTRG